jgi:hypothetical protein
MVNEITFALNKVMILRVVIIILPHFIIVNTICVLYSNTRMV